ESLAVGLVFPEHRVRIDPLAAAVRLDEPLLDGHDRAEFGAQYLRVDQVAHADAEPPDLVLEGGTDPPQGRPGPHVALQFLLRSESLAVGLVFPEHRVRIDPLAAAVRLDEPLLDGHDRAEFGAQYLRVDQVAHADAEPPDLVLEGGTDPPQGRPGPHVALQFLL